MSALDELIQMNENSSKDWLEEDYEMVIKEAKKELEQLKEGIKEGLEFINDTSLWEISSYNNGEIYIRCRFCLADYKYGHHEDCPAKIYIERWGE